jgi:hypothetical protein
LGWFEKDFCQKNLIEERSERKNKGALISIIGNISRNSDPRDTNPG